MNERNIRSLLFRLHIHSLIYVTIYPEQYRKRYTVIDTHYLLRYVKELLVKAGNYICKCFSSTPFQDI